MIYPCFLFCRNSTILDRDISLNREIYSNCSFTDIYHLQTNTDPQGFLYNYSLVTGYRQRWNSGILGVELVTKATDGKVSNLNAPQDNIRLNIPEEYLKVDYENSHAINPYLILGKDIGAGFTKGLSINDIKYESKISLHTQRAYLDYKIDSDHGRIPFYWNDAEFSIGMQSAASYAELSAHRVYPYKSDSLFSNNLYMTTIIARAGYRGGKNWKAKIQAVFTQASADLRYKGELYGKLDRLQYLYVTSGIEKSANHFLYKVNLDGCMTGIGDDSYFDIWPFTAWDVFLAHRTRVKSFIIRSISPGLGTVYIFSTDPDAIINGSSGVSYHQIIHQEDILVKNRRVVFYPFLFSYDSTHYNWQDRVDGYFQIPLSIKFRPRTGIISLDITQMIPVKWKKISEQSSSQPSSHTNRRQWGGTQYQLNISIPL